MSGAESFYLRKKRLEEDLLRSWSPAVESYARLACRLGHYWQPLAFIRQHAPKPTDAVTLAAYMHLYLGTGHVQPVRQWGRFVGAGVQHPNLVEQHLRLAVTTGTAISINVSSERHHPSVEILTEIVRLLDRRDSPADHILNRQWESAEELSECAYDLASFYAHANEHQLGLEVLGSWHRRVPDDPGIAIGCAVLLAVLREPGQCRELCEDMAYRGFRGVPFQILPLVAGEERGAGLFEDLRRMLAAEPLYAPINYVWRRHCPKWSFRSLEIAHRTAGKLTEAVNFGYRWKRST